MKPDKQTILEVILHTDGGIEFHVEIKETGMNYLTFVGLLEQLKVDILTENRREEMRQPETNQKYDA